MRTRVYQKEDGYLWHRTRLHRTPVTDPLGCFPTHTEEASVRVAPGTRRGNTFAYRLGASLTLGEALLQAWETNQLAALVSDFAKAGALSRRRQGTPPAPAILPPPLGAAHLRDWLQQPERAGAQTDTQARYRLHLAMRQSLGAARMRELTDWVDQLTQPAAHWVPLHGEFSLSALVPGPDHGPLWVLFGETVARGPLEYDTGWLLGELAEWSDLTRRRASADTPEAELLGEMGRALLRAAGTGLDAKWLGRVVVLRRLMHVVDHASYVGWSDLLLPYVDLMPELIDSRGMSTLNRMKSAGPRATGEE
ncbi:hypothetical protein H1V43_26150 [Streptomyces sp. PSKA54]|uniref:Aminoglycoside phosphotransferase domain-containing protein n=1 Tax=Streptomyces himalayensis subsp. aureolus TaxID=2758039 RepID=A0A7W2D4T4_9ACTN|nr:hypothetical protein [Streptomyces himalayensis]MBA4864771.1 hypothetical protein [Streptomyces himalayensis subsp. aureolus]